MGEGCWRTASNKRHMPVDNGSARARPVAAPRLEPSPPPPNAGTLHNMRWEDLVGDEAWDSTFSRRLLPFHLELQQTVPDMALGGGGISNPKRCKPRRRKGLRARGFASSFAIRGPTSRYLSISNSYCVQSLLRGVECGFYLLSSGALVIWAAASENKLDSTASTHSCAP